MAKNSVSSMTEKLRASSRELIRDIQDQRKRATDQLSALKELEEAVKNRQRLEAERQEMLDNPPEEQPAPADAAPEAAQEEIASPAPEMPQAQPEEAPADITTSAPPAQEDVPVAQAAQEPAPQPEEAPAAQAEPQPEAEAPTPAQTEQPAAQEEQPPQEAQAEEEKPAAPEKPATPKLNVVTVSLDEIQQQAQQAAQPRRQPIDYRTGQRPQTRAAQPQRPYQQPRDAQGQGGQRPYQQPREGQGGQQRPYPPRQGQGTATGQGGQRPAQPRTNDGFGRPTAPSAARTGPADARRPAAGRGRGGFDPARNRRNISEEEARANRLKARRNEATRGLDDDEFGGRRRGRRTARAPKIERRIIETATVVGERVPIKELAEKIGKPANEIIKRLMVLGIMVNINQDIDYDTAALVADEFGVVLEQEIEKTHEEQMVDDYGADEEVDLMTRPPIVTIMGHVDHGKTSLLDAIRKTRVTASEAGGITQHIGAYQVEINHRMITFLDTPGHEAFTSMRARGAQATDIAILVIAADDGVMPQTVEAINHAKAAGVPIIVAINKMDSPNANPARIKQQLTEYELVGEEWGGDTIMVEVSAVAGTGINELLEMILLVADMQELRANPAREAKGIIIEARLDKNRGPIATMLVQNGTLHVGDYIVVGTTSGRVRAMFNDLGERVDEAGPSVPVEVLGLEATPEAGDQLYVVEDERLARQVAEERRDKLRQETTVSSTPVTLDDLFSRVNAGDMKELNIIIKADVRGSAEAVKSSIEKLSNDEVTIKTIHVGVGAVTENDIMLASTSNAIIIAFNVQPSAAIRAAAEREGVDIRTYRVIYNAIEDMEMALKGMLDPEFREVVLGHAEVREVFRITGVGAVAGCYVTDGHITRNCQIRVLRDSVVLYEGRLSSLKRFKEDVREVAAGYECGMSVDGYNDIKEQDVLQGFIVEEVARD